MTRGAYPWSDPAVDAGFAAAYDGQPLAQTRAPVDAAALDRTAALHDPGAVAESPRDPDTPVPTLQDELDEQRDAASRPLTRDGRRARADRPGRLSPGRALAGAAVSVAGVLLGIGTLLWVSDDPSDGPGPVVQAPVDGAADDTALDGPVLDDPALDGPALEPFATVPEGETAPVDPSPLAPPPPVEAAPPAPAAAAPAPARTATRSLEIPVTVLNNSRITGLADRAAARFSAGGWPVAKTGNFRGRIPSTTVYYERGQEASARAFARRFDGIVRVRPRFATLPARGLVVVVTRDYAR